MRDDDGRADLVEKRLASCFHPRLFLNRVGDGLDIGHVIRVEYPVAHLTRLASTERLVDHSRKPCAGDRRTHIRPLRMQLRLGPQREVLHRCEALRDELGREDGLTKATVQQPWRPGRRRQVYDVHLVALVEEPGCPSSSAIGLVEKIL